MVGYYQTDLIIEDQVIVELKAKLRTIKCTIPVNIIDNQSG
jgi:hypothetical protein